MLRLPIMGGVFQITGPLFGHFLVPKDQIKTVADQTANGAFAQLARGARYALVRLYLKAFTAGTGTNPPIFVIEAASDSGFTADVISAGVITLDRSDEGAGFAIAFSPLKALDFWRIRPIFDGTDAGTYDAEIAAV